MAEALGLSKRTIEYYVKNMRHKLNAKTKFELIDLILKSEFQKHLPKLSEKLMHK